MLEKIKDLDLRVFTVYLPILQSDSERSVPDAMKSLSDNRVIFFWDGKGKMGDSYSTALQLPAGRTAWDVYLLFDRDAEWKNESPRPDVWMHQLRGLPAENRFDGPKLAEIVNKLLGVSKK